MSKKQTYLESYVDFGFDLIATDDVQNPQCIFCSKVLGSGSMKLSILKAHFTLCHSTHVHDNHKSLLAKRTRFPAAGTLPKLGFCSADKAGLEASYCVAYRIAKEKKPLMIGERPITLCTMEMVELVCGVEQKRKLEKIAFSNDTIRCRISDMSQDILNQVADEIQASKARISYQLDESTDVSNCAYLLVYYRYEHAGELKEEFLMCKSLEMTTKWVKVLEKMDNFFQQNKISWKNVGSLCTHNAPSMLGAKSGFTILVKKHAPHIISTHCALHRHALASKTLPEYLKAVLKHVIECVNFIRAHALNHCLFKVLCDQMGSEHTVVLYHTEVRWLSRGLEFSNYVETFLQERKSPLSKHFDDNKFIGALTYLADIFSSLNQLNVQMQGKNVTIIDVCDKIQGFQKKLDLWSRRVQKGIYTNFPTFDDWKVNRSCNEISDLKVEIRQHLATLKNNFDGYFEGAITNSTAPWITHSFKAKLESIADDDLCKDELIDLQCSMMLHSKFMSCNGDFSKFWCGLVEEFPMLIKHAFEVIIPFAMTYLCEAGFSSLLTIKTKLRSCLVPKDDMRVALSTTAPRISEIVRGK